MIGTPVTLLPILTSTTTKEFEAHPDCKLCDLSSGCKRPGLPSRVHSQKGFGQALYVLSQAPGPAEDKAGVIHVGDSGKIMDRLYMDGPGISDIADIYYANTVRCRPQHNADPTNPQIKACLPYVHDDLHVLLDRYGLGNVTILCVGATAVKALFKCSLKGLLNDQGRTYVLPHEATTSQTSSEGVSIPVYATYHPAYLSSGRSPSAARNVECHIVLLKRALGGTDDYAVSDVHGHRLPSEQSAYSIISIDIETYGCLAGVEQTVFHTHKSVAVDGIARGDLIVSVACTFADGTNWFRPWGPRARRDLRTIFARAKCLLGQNLIFDLSFLRYCDPALRNIMDSRYLEGGLCLWDLAVTNYLNNEIRPERSLKSLSPLMGYGKYESHERSLNFKDANDPLLATYNVRDTARTLALHRDIRDRSLARYKDTAKHSEYCNQWYSELLWSVLFSVEAGHAFDRDKLEALCRYHKKRMARCEAISLARYGEPLSGKDSQKFIRAMIVDIACGLSRGRAARLETSKKTKILSTNDFNLTYMHYFSNVPEHRKFLKLIRRFRKARKLVGTYLEPFILDNSKTRLIEGKSYQTVYIVPSAFEDDKEGGTNQSRLASFLQTMPPSIKACSMSRFKDGVLLAADLSQIELRTAALLSNDPAMMEDYELGRDRHASTACSIFEASFMPEDYDQRQVGKQTNFLTLFRGSATKLEWTLWKKAGLRYPFSKCQIAIDTFWKRHKRLSEWQEEQVRCAISGGVIELPFIGQSKLFLGSERAVRSQLQAICNFPVQTTASNIMLSAYTTLTRAMRERGLRSVITLLIHDALYVDCRPTEVRMVKQLIRRIMPNPPYYLKLCKLLGRSLPLTYDLDLH